MEINQGHRNKWSGNLTHTHLEISLILILVFNIKISIYFKMVTDKIKVAVRVRPFSKRGENFNVWHTKYLLRK